MYTNSSALVNLQPFHRFSRLPFNVFVDGNLSESGLETAWMAFCDEMCPSSW